MKPMRRTPRTTKTLAMFLLATVTWKTPTSTQRARRRPGRGASKKHNEFSMKNLLNLASREGGVTQMEAGAGDLVSRSGTAVEKHSRRRRFWSSNRAGDGGTTRSRGRTSVAAATSRRGASGDREEPVTGWAR